MIYNNFIVVVISAQGIITRGHGEIFVGRWLSYKPERSKTAGPRLVQEKIKKERKYLQVLPSWHSEGSETAGLRHTMTEVRENIRSP
jgi:hypothetical protein